MSVKRIKTSFRNRRSLSRNGTPALWREYPQGYSFYIDRKSWRHRKDAIR